MLWLERGAELLDEWVRLHPGSRSSSWWLFAPEPTRQLSGRSGLLTDRYRNLRVPIDRGVPEFFEVDENDPPVFETGLAYLERLGLLLDGELVAD